MGLEVYATALVTEFEDDTDAKSVFDHLMLNPREEFEAAMPSLPDLLGMVRRKGKEREWAQKRAEREACEREQREDLARRQRENPDSFFTIGEVMQDWAKQQSAPVPIAPKSIDRSQEPAPVHWTPEQIASWPAKVQEMYRASQSSKERAA